MFKNILIVLLAASTAVLAVIVSNRPSVAFTLSAQSSTERKGPDQSSAKTPPPAVESDLAKLSAVEAELAANVEENKKLNTTMRELKGEISILMAGRSSGPAGSRPGGAPPVRGMLHDLLGKPETIQMGMDWIKADIGPRYASLIALHPNLTDTQREELTNLLAERYATRMDLAAAGTGNLTPELKKQLDAEHHTKLAQLVGEDGAALFEKTEVKPISWERMQRLDQRLRFEASPLNKQQYTEIWPILSDAVFYYKPPTNQEEADALIEKRVAANQRARERAQGLLSADQLNSVTRLLNDDLAMWRVNMHASANRPQPTTQPPAAPPQTPAATPASPSPR